MQTRINYRETEEEKKHVRAKKLWRKNCVVAAMERLLLTGRACTDRHGAGACTVTCQVVIFVCRGELDGELVATWTDRAAARTDAEEGSRDRWSMTPPVWIREHGVRACLCTVGVCRERKRSGSKRGESERGTAGIRAVAWLGSDWAESQAKDSDVPLPCAPSFPFLSFTFPSPRVSSRSRARTSRAVHSVNRDSVDSDVGSATRDSSLDRFLPSSTGSPPQSKLRLVTRPPKPFQRRLLLG